MNLPNKLTLGRLIGVPLFVAVWYAPFSAHKWVALAVFVLAALTDLFDGRIARATGQVTAFGKFMDPIADKALVLTAAIALLDTGDITVIAVLVYTLREIIVSGFRLVAVEKGVVVPADNLGKLKTVSQIVAISLLIVDNWPFAFIGFPMDVLWLWASVALTLISGVSYIVKGRAVFH